MRREVDEGAQVRGLECPGPGASTAVNGSGRRWDPVRRCDSDPQSKATGARGGSLNVDR